jgi:serine/threonine-protein kinase RsbW
VLNATKILVIKSDKSELKKVEKFVTDVFREFNLTRNNFNKTLLCISEAVINSIEHGNQFDRKKSVTIQMECNKDELHVEIYDEGEGFDLSNVENPTKRENIKRESGRGIYIIKSLSDSLQYNKKGNSVQLKIECK